MGLKVNKSLKYNPQSNAILERVHQVLQDCLLTMDFDNADIDPNEDNPFEMGLAKAAQAIRGGFHQTHGASPCKLVFGRDMFMPKDAEVDWDVIKARKQERTAKSNARENSKKENKKYSPGDWITVKKPGILRKLCVPRDGPYQVIKHHDNGMVAFEKV